MLNIFLCFQHVRLYCREFKYRSGAFCIGCMLFSLYTRIERSENCLLCFNVRNFIVKHRKSSAKDFTACLFYLIENLTIHKFNAELCLLQMLVASAFFVPIHQFVFLRLNRSIYICYIQSISSKIQWSDNQVFLCFNSVLLVNNCRINNLFISGKR